MSNGKIKVTDFGIAKMPNSESLTMADKAIGTVYYISPEQASNRNIDARSDIYSLGAMLYEMVTGKMPFTADSPVAIIMQHIQDPPASPSKIAPGIPKGLEQIILCAMEKNPRNRYQSAAQMLRHLRRLKMDEKTVFNIMRPAPLTDTSEIKIKKTTKRSHGHSDNKDNSIEVKKTTPKNTEFPTNKTPLNGENNGSGVTPNTANTGSVKQNAAPKQAGTAKAAGASAKPSPVAPQGRRSKKKNFNYVTTFLVVIIILLILAIWGIIAVVLTPDTSGEMLFSHGISRVAAKSLLYLKQGIL